MKLVKTVKEMFANLLARIHVRTLVKLLVKMNAKAANIVKEMFVKVSVNTSAKHAKALVKKLLNVEIVNMAAKILASGTVKTHVKMTINQNDEFKTILNY